MDQCNHQIIFDQGEYICSKCGVVIENYEQSRHYFDKLNKIFWSEGKISYWNRRFCLGSKPIKRYRFAYRLMLPKDREYREYRILIWLQEKYGLKVEDLNKIKVEFQKVKKLTKKKLYEIVKKYLNQEQFEVFCHQFS